MKFAFAALTDLGLSRPNNEDNFIVLDLATGERRAPPPASCEGTVDAEHGLLLAVADGMGGEAAGEVASRIAIEALAAAVRTVRPTDTDEEARERIRAAIVAANGEIHRASVENPLQRGMGTTLTAALVRGNRIQFFQVGDSRGYVVRHGTLQRMTKDHSLIGTLVDDKVITAEDAESLEGGRNLILQALGPDPNVRIDGSEAMLEDGDVVLLCTDGLHGPVKHRELQGIAAAATDSGKLCEDLVAKAREHGAPDNVTVAAFTVLEPPMLGFMGRLTAFLRRVAGRVGALFRERP